MPRIEPELQRLQEIKTLPSLVKYLREKLNWPIESDDLELTTFEYEVAELGFDAAASADIEEVRQLRPLTPNQKWGIFWVKFGKKQLPVQMLRRALGNLVVKKRASTKKSDKAAWHMHDLLFISAYGDDSNRHITFAHFSEGEEDEKSLPVLKVLGWDEDDTLLKLKDTYKTLVSKLNWETTPTSDPEAWRAHWSSAFKVGHREVINTTKELVLELAHLASVIKKSVLTSIKAETDKGPWKKLMLAFQKTLIKDLDEEQFADVIAQTISYGLLTARLSSNGPISLKNLVDMVPATNPFLKELLRHFLTSAGMKGLFDVDEAGINDVVELLNRANAEAIRNDFGNRTAGEDPVIHFYEHFLGAYNKKLKVERGVFYTPQPVVSYIVRSVHELLQTEFGLEDGLADTSTWADMQKKHKDLKVPEGIKRPDIEPFVQILDPATGTATFLIEVIDVIHKTMTAKWDKERVSKAEQVKKWNTYVPTHLLPRLYAYELMMAPYAIAHMKVGLKLSETGFTAWDKIDKENRANIFLTNALEPWEKQLKLAGFDALANEAAAVNQVKRNKCFTVVIGNPPYAGHSANPSKDKDGTPTHIGQLIKRYFTFQNAKLKEKQTKWLHDDYVKFFRLAETTINYAGFGVIGLITNHGFIFNPTFRGMRESLLNSFNNLTLLDLHGSLKLKEQATDGGVDQNVFDIEQGVAITLGAASCNHVTDVRHASIYGVRELKYKILSLTSVATTSFVSFSPNGPFVLLRPQQQDLAAEWNNWPRIVEIMPLNAVGVVTGRDKFAIDENRDALRRRVEKFCDPHLTDSEVRDLFDIRDGGGYILAKRRSITKGTDATKYLKRVHYRPFDHRWIAYSRGFLTADQYGVMQHLLAKKNLALLVGRAGQVIDSGEWNLIFVSREPTEFNLYRRGGNNVFPLVLQEDDSVLSLSSDSRPNFAPTFLNSIASALQLPKKGEHGLPAGLTAEDIFGYAYATFHSINYRSRYAEFLKIDFPHLPLTASLKLFSKLAQLGNKLTALHLLESPIINKPITEFFGAKNTEVDKVTWSKDTVWIDKAQTTGFKGVNEEVWDFYIGGYQICEKWLKDRKGRKLTKEDIEHYQKIVVAISETIRLMAEIDKVIDEHGGWPGAFQSSKVGS